MQQYFVFNHVIPVLDGEGTAFPILKFLKFHINGIVAILFLLKK